MIANLMPCLGPARHALLRVLCVVVATTGALAFAPASLATDLGVVAPAAPAAPDARKTMEDYLKREAVLLMIRATFDVPGTDVGGQLKAVAARLGPSGPSAWDESRLETDLTAEGSYYLVSLKYLILAGGAVWPPDRSETAYENDALVELDTLQTRLLDEVTSGADPLQTLQRAQLILAETNGHQAVGASSDRFADRDKLVDDALRDGPWANG